MILKQLRISRHMTQDQLAQMSGLNVRTIQRIESGHSASLESLKCLASVLEVDVSTLTEERIMIDKKSDNWKRLSPWLKFWFFLNYCSFTPSRSATKRAVILSHVSGFLFCGFGLAMESVLVGGLFMLLVSYLFMFLKWQGDKYGVWYDSVEGAGT